MSVVCRGSFMGQCVYSVGENTCIDFTLVDFQKFSFLTRYQGDPLIVLGVLF